MRAGRGEAKNSQRAVRSDGVTGVVIDLARHTPRSLTETRTDLTRISFVIVTKTPLGEGVPVGDEGGTRTRRDGLVVLRVGIAESPGDFRLVRLLERRFWAKSSYWAELGEAASTPA